MCSRVLRITSDGHGLTRALGKQPTAANLLLFGPEIRFRPVRTVIDPFFRSLTRRTWNLLEYRVDRRPGGARPLSRTVTDEQRKMELGKRPRQKTQFYAPFKESAEVQLDRKRKRQEGMLKSAARKILCRFLMAKHAVQKFLDIKAVDTLFMKEGDEVLMHKEPDEMDDNRSFGNFQYHNKNEIHCSTNSLWCLECRK